MSKAITTISGILLFLLLPASVMAQTTKPSLNQILSMTPAQRVVFAFPALQEDLGLNDADFSTVLTKILKVDYARGQYMDRRIPRNPLPGSGAARRGLVPRPWRELQDLTPIDYALNELNDLLKDPNTPNDAIKSKLDTYHAARDKAWADLKIAEEELKAILTTRQEAILVGYYGLLD